MLIRVGYRSVLIVGLIRNELSMFCLSVVHMIPRDNLFYYLKQILLPDAFEALFHGIAFDKAVFCLGEKQDMFVKDECSCWYKRIGNFLLLVCNRRKKFCLAMEHHSRPVRPTPLQSG